ncbi:MAG: hypothetical protein M3P33_03195 [bacterium]|nr:hypothetical protein [bacterium]
MEIFFGVSLRAVEKQRKEFDFIYNTLKNLGFEHLNDLPLMQEPKKFYEMTSEQILHSYKDLNSKIHRAKIVVIEATIHSLTMGFFIKMALELNKPLIVLHLPGCKPYLFSGIENDKLQIVEYTLETLPEVLKLALDYASEKTDVRFNFFINSEVSNYLKWAAQESDTQKSNFVRELIIEHRTKNYKKYLEAQKK